MTDFEHCKGAALDSARHAIELGNDVLPCASFLRENVEQATVWTPGFDEDEKKVIFKELALLGLAVQSDECLFTWDAWFALATPEEYFSDDFQTPADREYPQEALLQSRARRGAPLETWFTPYRRVDGKIEWNEEDHRSEVPPLPGTVDDWMSTAVRGDPPAGLVKNELVVLTALVVIGFVIRRRQADGEYALIVGETLLPNDVIGLN